MALANPMMSITAESTAHPVQQTILPKALPSPAPMAFVPQQPATSIITSTKRNISAKNMISIIAANMEKFAALLMERCIHAPTPTANVRLPVAKTDIRQTALKPNASKINRLIYFGTRLC